MLKKGSKVRYLGETTRAYKNGKVYEVCGYDPELDAWGGYLIREKHMP